ncbi:MAG: hypothetical protein A3F80_01480 [Candidatus Melainabacteria bacterium RIFCSPLOWO2_12_FULL_35_11]|nr:MAG: hypothetical protein A3F80_01480 [Candidatus Melainabacteria bacterium RIFCSPLOWO2_12_FULL_35_11]
MLAIFAVIFGGGSESFAATDEPVSAVEPVSKTVTCINQQAAVDAAQAALDTCKGTLAATAIDKSVSADEPANELCDDNNTCTDDNYDPLIGCIHTNNTASCNDDNECTTDDVCSNGNCIGVDQSNEDQDNDGIVNAADLCPINPDVTCGMSPEDDSSSEQFTSISLDAEQAAPRPVCSSENCKKEISGRFLCFGGNPYCVSNGGIFSGGFQCLLGYPNDGTRPTPDNAQCICAYPNSCRQNGAGLVCSDTCNNKPCTNAGTGERIGTWQTTNSLGNEGCQCI